MLLQFSKLKNKKLFTILNVFLYFYNCVPQSFVQCSGLTAQFLQTVCELPQPTHFLKIKV